MLTITLFVFYFSFMCILFYNQELEITQVESTLNLVSVTPTLSDYAQAFSVEPDQEENQSQLDAINQIVQSSNKKQLRKLCSFLKIKQTRTEQGKRVELTAAQMKIEIIKHYHCYPHKVMETITTCLPEKLV